MHAGGCVRRRHPPPVPRPQVARPAHPGADGYLGRVPRSIPVRGETENVSWLVTGAGPGVLVLVLVLAAVVVGSLLAWVRRPATMPAARARASRCQGRPCRIRAGTSRAARMSGHPARPAATGAGTYGRSAARSAYASTVPRGAQLGVGGRGGGITSHVPAVRPVRVGGGGDGPQAARICSSVRCGSVGSPRTVNGFTRWPPGPSRRPAGRCRVAAAAARHHVYRAAAAAAAGRGGRSFFGSPGIFGKRWPARCRLS